MSSRRSKQRKQTSSNENISNESEPDEFSNVTMRYLGFWSLVVVLVFILHLKAFPSWEDLKKKSTDYMAPLYSLITLISTLVGALGFGKPYSPAIITTIGFVSNNLFAWFVGLPGMVDWVDKLISLIVVIALLVQYAYRCHQYMKRREREDSV